MSKKSNIIIICLLLVLDLSVILLVLKPIKETNIEISQTIETLDKQIRQNESIIDSLENIISLRESIIDSLSFLRQEVITEKVIVTREIRELPLSDGVEFLKEKLKEYEEDYEDYLMSGESITP